MGTPPMTRQGIRSVNDDSLHRKHPAHGVAFIEGQPTIVFDTVCTKDRKPWLANEDVHAVLRKVWQNATAWLVGRYMIMPDHIHYFAVATDPTIEYENWVKYWKSQVTKSIRQSVKEKKMARLLPSLPDHLWQTDHWDTRVRSEEMYDEKWLYVLDNPQRNGLVAKSEDWPFQGEIFELRWR